jgi:N-methylhydantoinase B
MTTRKSQLPDPVVGAIVRRLITNAAKEMGITLIRATRSPVLFEAKDFATGVFDARGRVLEQHQYLPLMAFCLGPAVKHVIDEWGSRAAPGDAYVLNDTYRSGTHAMDVSVVRPVFHGDRLVGWTGCKGHMMDWGGPVPSGYNASARSAWEEPLRVPPVPLYWRGERVESTFALISANVREAEIVGHDLDAMVGCTQIGAGRLGEIVDRFGPDALEELTEAWIGATTRQLRQFIAKLPDGEYQGSSEVRDSRGVRTPIRVTVSIRGSHMRFDFSGTGPQTPTFVNAPETVTRGGVLQCMAILVGQGVDFNQGFMDAVDVHVPPQSVLAARFPAAVGYALHLTDQISEAVFRALAPAVPERVIAGWLQWGTSVSGTWRGKAFSTPLFFPSKGGSGAKHGSDGYDYIGSIRMSGALESEDVEMFERVHPWMEIRELAYWPDSGGIGQWRGGLGVYSEVVLHGDNMEIATFGTGRDGGAEGLFGGGTSPRGRLILTLPSGRTIDVPAMANITGLPAGTVMQKWNTGGGGYGDPEHRDEALKKRDLLEGYTTPAGRARRQSRRRRPRAS